MVEEAIIFISQWINIENQKKKYANEKKAHFMIEYALCCVQAQIDTVKCNVHTIKKQDHQAQLEVYWNIFFFLEILQKLHCKFQIRETGTSLMKN